jgi:hypothetical protein
MGYLFDKRKFNRLFGSYENLDFNSPLTALRSITGFFLLFEIVLRFLIMFF